MRVAMPCRDGQIDPHFGQAENFKIYFIENGQVVRDLVMPAGGSGHEEAVRLLKSAGVQFVICGGIGGAAIKALDRAGIMVMGGILGNCDEKIRSFNEGKLRYIPADKAVPHCAHHAAGDSEACADGSCPDAANCGYHVNN